MCIRTWINRINDTPDIKKYPQSNYLCMVNQHRVILIYDGTSQIQNLISINNENDSNISVQGIGWTEIAHKGPTGDQIGQNMLSMHQEKTSMYIVSQEKSTLHIATFPSKS